MIRTVLTSTNQPITTTLRGEAMVMTTPTTTPIIGPITASSTTTTISIAIRLATGTQVPTREAKDILTFAMIITMVLLHHLIIHGPRRKEETATLILMTLARAVRFRA